MVKVAAVLIVFRMEHNRKKQLSLGAIVLLLSFWVFTASAETDQKTVLCEYNRTKALILVEYAAVAYIVDDTSLLSWTCSRCYGLTKGFKVHALIVDVQHCLQAFVGVAENLKATIVAFRGTQQSRYIVGFIQPITTPRCESKL